MNRSKGFIRLIIPALLLLMCLTLPGTLTRAQSDPYLPGEVLVKLFQASDLAGVASDYALAPVPLAQFGARAIYRMSILDGALPPDRAAALSNDPRVSYAEPNFTGYAPEGTQQVSWAKGDNMPGFTQQWAAMHLRLPEAHTVTRGAGITVAVLDTGVDHTHPALAGKLLPGYDFVDMDNDPSEVGNHVSHPLYGHGTHVAGLIALVAPEAKILPIRVLDPDGMGNIWVLAEALTYAMNPDGDPATADGADVINLSLSASQPTNLLPDIVAGITCDDDDDDECPASQRGAVVVVAAGNNGSSLPEFPASEGVAGMLAVGAITSNGELTSFSNFGSWVHLAAPGEQILSSVPGPDGYGLWSGTSMAAPLVAGQAALVRAAYPHFDPPTVVTQILSSSEDVGGLVPLRADVAASVGIPVLHIQQEVSCHGTIGGIKVDGILVPKGKTCTLNGTRILGSIKVEQGGTLYAYHVVANGSLQADKAKSVHVYNAQIQGSVQIKESSSVIMLIASQIDSDVQLEKNKGAVVISDNTIGSNLQCKENRIRPVGSGNTVLGNSEEQCSGF